jgi:hypothetical protein
MNMRFFTRTMLLLFVLWNNQCIVAINTSNPTPDIIEADRLVIGIPDVDVSSLNIPKDYQQIECHLTPIPQNIPHKKPLNISSKPLKEIFPWKYSYSWSGYAAATSWDDPIINSVTTVAGTWTVPAIQPSTTDSYCVIWVGIDGFHHRNKTVEQIGTGHCWLNGAAFHYAWFQMFPDTPSNMIKDFPVEVGDVITAMVNYTSNNIFLMRIYNTTKKKVFTIPGQYTTSSTAKRQSAEWIVEAPSSYTALLPLANFTTVRFTNCKATINDKFGYLPNDNWLFKPIRMIDGGGTLKAMPSDLLGGSTFTVTWLRQ